MLDQYKLENILFLDIETVPLKRYFKDLPKVFQQLFKEKMQQQNKENKKISSLYEERAGLLAEFSKIICITVGVVDSKKKSIGFHWSSNHRTIREYLFTILRPNNYL